MTDSTTPSDASVHPDPVRPYAAPELTELGTVGAVTAGPDSGTLDQLGGASSGWLVANGTS